MVVSVKGAASDDLIFWSDLDISTMHELDTAQCLKSGHVVLVKHTAYCIMFCGVLCCAVLAVWSTWLLLVCCSQPQPVQQLLQLTGASGRLQHTNAGRSAGGGCLDCMLCR